MGLDAVQPLPEGSPVVRGEGYSWGGHTLVLLLSSCVSLGESLSHRSPWFASVNGVQLTSLAMKTKAGSCLQAVSPAPGGNAHRSASYCHRAQ